MDRPHQTRLEHLLDLYRKRDYAEEAKKFKVPVEAAEERAYEDLWDCMEDAIKEQIENGELRCLSCIKFVIFDTPHKGKSWCTDHGKATDPDNLCVSYTCLPGLEDKFPEIM